MITFFISFTVYGQINSKLLQKFEKKNNFAFILMELTQIDKQSLKFSYDLYVHSIGPILGIPIVPRSLPIWPLSYHWFSDPAIHSGVSVVRNKSTRTATYKKPRQTKPHDVSSSNQKAWERSTTIRVLYHYAPSTAAVICHSCALTLSYEREMKGAET
jgi:hypothetical protein